MKATDAREDGPAPSELYAGLAAAFRYPAHDRPHVLDASEFLRAFDPAVSPGAVSLRESSYVSQEASALLEELVRFYEFFGLRRRPESLLPDHLSVELEFMQFLSAREGSGESARVSASLRLAQRDFLDRHLLRLVDAAAERAETLDSAAARDVLETCRRLVYEQREAL